MADFKKQKNKIRPDGVSTGALPKRFTMAAVLENYAPDI
jgi:hypothetical protein